MAVKMKRANCACGCGVPPKGPHSKWRQGHRAYGENGYKNRYDRKPGRIGRGKYPSKIEIIRAHSQFIRETEINPQLCWACQQNTATVRCHVISVMRGGDNHPENLILLDELCHIFQGWSDTESYWNIKKQYEWLINFERTTALFELHQKGPQKYIEDNLKKMMILYGDESGLKDMD